MIVCLIMGDNPARLFYAPSISRIASYPLHIHPGPQSQDVKFDKAVYDALTVAIKVVFIVIALTCIVIPILISHFDYQVGRLSVEYQVTLLVLLSMASCTLLAWLIRFYYKSTLKEYLRAQVYANAVVPPLVSGPHFS